VIFDVVVAVIGLLVGSFLNVVIWRVPRGESVIRPRSRCPGCEVPIRERDNIPVLSWLVLRGRCRSCKTPISVRYPIVELLTGILFGLFAWKFGPHYALIAFLFLLAVSIALAAIDLDTRRLPDALTLPSYPVGAVLLIASALLQHHPHLLLNALYGGLALFGLYAVLWFIQPKGMGLGDVKLAGVLGMFLGYLGWRVLAVGAFLGFAYGAIIGITLMLAHRAGRKSKIPFGPFMVAGAVTAILVGSHIASAYLGVSRG
jgi:leader peptidase (prepilin peptidase) / N-methyltransferase